MLDKPITLPIYYDTDETLKLSELEIDYPLSDCEIRRVKFYSISSIEPKFDKPINNKPYSIVNSGGISFVCPLSSQEVEEQIKKQRL